MRRKFLTKLAKAEGFYQLSSVTEKAHNKFYSRENFPRAAEVWALSNGHIFFSPNPRTEFSGKDEAVKKFNAFFADYDSSDKGKLKKRLGEFPVKPSAVIFSGRGYHIYWFFKEAEELKHDYFRGIQKGIAKFLGADTTIFNPSRLMRLPGSLNRKNGKKVEVIFLGENEINPSNLEMFYIPVQTVKIELPESSQETGRIEPDEIKKLPVSRTTKLRILRGELGGAPSRSERDIRIVRALLSLHWPRNKIIGLFSDPRYGCSDKVREKERDGLRYLLFTIEKAKEYKEEK